MRKSFKLILVIALLLLVNIQNVKAESVSAGGNVKIYARPLEFVYKTGFEMSYEGGWRPYDFDFYTLTGENGEKYVAYCRNASASATSEGGNNISVEQQFEYKNKVFDPNVEANTPAEKAEKAYEKGIIEILQRGYNGYKNGGNNNYETYIIANIAMRTFEMMWEREDTNSPKYESALNKAMKYYTNIMIYDAAVQRYAKEINSLLGSKYVRSSGEDAYTNVNEVLNWDGNSELTERIRMGAYNLVKNAFTASIKYLEEGAASLTWNEKPLTTKMPVTDDTENYESVYTYNFDVKNFTSRNSSIKMDFICNDCSKYDLDYEIYINDPERNKKYTNISNIEFLNYVTNGTGKIKLDIVFKADSNDYHCEKVDFNINLKYLDDTISTEAYVVRDADCTDCQWFYMLLADNVEKKGKIDGVAELCSLSCEDAKKQCEANPKSQACDIYYETYGGDCAECTTYIENAVCSEEDSEIFLNEGYDVDTSNCGNVNEDSLNVKQCIIGGEDQVGNSYQATTESFEKVADNEFCAVYCKEDYHFTLPGIKEANSGRYFSLKASISGTKTCYTSQIDAYNTFENKLEEKREEVIDAWNEWNKWYQGLNGDYVDSDNPHTASDNSCDQYDYDPCPTEEDPNKTCRGDCVDECSCSVEYDGYERSWSYETYDYKGNPTDNTHTDDRDGGSAWCGCDSGGGKNGSVSNIVTAIRGNLRAAESTLKSAINDYINLLNQYNSCSGINTVLYDIGLNASNGNGWNVDYNYDPKIKFWYQESYMNNVITDELETIGNVSMSEITQSLCTGNTDEGYNTCNVGWKTNLDKNDTMEQFVCKQIGSEYECGTEEIIVSNATYVKQEMTASGKYITPTQFYTIYPTGAIVSAEKGKEDEIENSVEGINILPVGLGTKQGVYNYSLKVSDLGEYYNKDELGRLWGDSNSVVVKVLEDAQNNNSCTKEGALTTIDPSTGASMDDANYICAYKVNCPNCPVVCDPVCEYDGCPDNNCPVVCDKCIYTNNSTNIGYRPITPGDINPNDREMGVNWKYAENAITTALELKAYVTTKEIEEAGETIYEIDYEDTTANADTGFAMKVKLNREMINIIRSYNDNYENNEGYANNTLKCYDHVNSNDGKTYENIYCYSTFLDKLIEEDGGPDANGGSENVKIVGGTRYFTEAERENKTQTSGYWTTWSEASSNKWITSTSIGFVYNKNYKNNVADDIDGIGIGPSWK